MSQETPPTPLATAPSQLTVAPDARAEQAIALVTGAAGFIGSHLAERLITEGFDVIGVDSFTDFYPRFFKERNLESLRASPRFEFVEADLESYDVAAMLKGANVRYIFHNAGQAGVRASWGRHFDEYVTRNILATQRLLEACVSVSLARFVFASSSSVYGDAEKLPTDEEQLPRPVSPYGVTKLAAEQLCFLYAQQFQVPVVALRYFSVYGPRQRPDMAFHLFIEALLHDKPISIFGDGEQTREFTFVEDILQANLLAARANLTANGHPHVYNIGGGSHVTLNAALELLGELTGKRPRVEYMPRAAGDHRQGAADITRARRDLKYAPRVSLEEGLQRQVEWQRQADARP